MGMSNVVDDYEYYFAEEDVSQVLRRRIDGSGEEVVYDQSGNIYGLFVLPECLLIDTGSTLITIDHDGSNKQVIDENVDVDRIAICEDYILCDNFSTPEKLFRRTTFEEVDIPDNVLASSLILMVEDDQYYYFTDGMNEPERFCRCDMSGENEEILMSFEDGFRPASGGSQQIAIVDGDMYFCNNMSRTLYKFPAGTTVASRDMELKPPEPRRILQIEIEGDTIYCTDDTELPNTYFMMDTDGNFLGDCSEDDFTTYYEMIKPYADF